MTGLAIYDILTSNTPVTNLVGTRIFPDMATQQAVYPFVVYEISNTAPTNTKDGPSGLDEVTVNVMAYSNSYAEAQNIADKIRRAIDRTRGTFAGVVIQSIEFQNQLSTAMSFEKRVYIVEQSYIVREVRDGNI
jgi:hypothetical protein